MPIVVENVTHIYMPGTPFEMCALRDVNLTIQDGEFWGIIGHTGSGKSTLIQHFNGLLKPSAGRVLFNGQDINEKGSDIKKIRAQIGLVFQYPEYQLFEETVYKDIAYGPNQIGVDPSEIENRVQKAMDLVEIDWSKKDKSPLELSGGEKRRVAIAGVLAMEPSTLVMDEPIAGLDPLGKREILRLMKQMHKNGATVVMVSHSMDDMAVMAQKIAVMNKGAVERTGTPQEIFSEGEYLESIGLELPQAAQLKEALRKRGKAIPLSFDVERLAEKIAERINRDA
ncbi:MAG: energy-coupling factor transporter ATPase [Christensenellales bacterium]